MLDVPDSADSLDLVAFVDSDHNHNILLYMLYIAWIVIGSQHRNLHTITFTIFTDYIGLQSYIFPDTLRGRATSLYRFIYLICTYYTYSSTYI